MSKRKNKNTITVRKGHHNKSHGLNRPTILGGLLFGAAAIAAIGYFVLKSQPLIREYETPVTPISCELRNTSDAYQLSVAGNTEAGTDNSDDIGRIVRLTVGQMRRSTSNSKVEIDIDGFGTGYDIGGNMIVTAKHVIETGNSKTPTVIVTNASGSTLGYVAAVHSKADLALVSYSNKKQLPGVTISEPRDGAGISALVIDDDSLNVKFDEAKIKSFNFTKIGTEGHYTDQFVSDEHFVRPGMSGSALLEGGIYAGTLVVDESRIHEISFGIKFNEKGEGTGMPPKTAEKQVMQSTNTRALIELLQAACK